MPRVSPDRDDEYLGDDAEERRSKHGVLSAGWLRALLVLSALAVVLVITVPYLLQWLSGPTPPSPRPALTETPRTEPTKVQTAATAPTPAPPVATPTPEPPAKTEMPAAKPEPPAKTEMPAAKPEPPAKTEMPSAKPDPPAKTEMPSAKPDPPSRPEVAVKSEPASKSEPAALPSPKPLPKASAGSGQSTATPTTPGGEYWVQVGLFANGDNAERLAKELRDERFSVEVTQAAKGGSSATASSNQHEVVVNGSTVEAVTAALKGTGTAEVSGDAVVVRPAMDLKDAVALSRRLAGEGLEVRIRRMPAAPAAGGATHYIVRVGGYVTREAAAAGRRELAAKGVGGFVTQGPAK
jgi:type IV secretory pathway VirB10-like protein